MQLLSAGEKYGYELVEALARQSGGVLAMGQSTLYPMLYNLEAKGLVKSRVDESGPRPRRYYRLTAKGGRKLAADSRQWAALFDALRSLDVLPQPGLGPAGGTT
ncbi:MAG: PadR family transcriptional regulator [Planctomycetota bacterium]